MSDRLKFGNKYKDIEGIFTYIPYDVTVRDSEGNYIGTKDDLPIFHLNGTFGSLDSDQGHYPVQELKGGGILWRIIR